MSKSIVRSIKNVANGYSSGQVLVRNATSNDPSGPSKFDMEEIAAHTRESQTGFLEVMDMLDRRLNDKGKNWRHVAKSLTVLDYLVRFGPEKCVLWSKDNLYVIKTLREFIHNDANDNDQGAIIRVKAKELVAILRDDERLRHERELAQRSMESGGGRKSRRKRNTINDRNGEDPYDDDLQRALELSKITAEQEQNRPKDVDDSDLQAALRLSKEEEEMRKARQQQGDNLLDLTDNNLQMQPQFYLATGYAQQPQYQTYPQQTQYDIFNNPIQSQMTAGIYQQPYFQPQQQPQQLQQLQQPQQNQFTGFNYGQPQQQQLQELKPLKTGSNNPFALPNETSPYKSQQLQGLDDLAAEQYKQQLLQQQQQAYFQASQNQTQQALKPQSTSSSKFNDSTHSELNNLLAQGTGIDTFGNTGSTRIPHQHTKAQQFINSSGTGYRQQTSEVRLSSNATGNPFLNTGIGYQQQGQYNPTHTGYGFGNANIQAQQNQRGPDGPSLIDI